MTSAPPLTYALVTPAHNEADNLPRLADAVAAQTQPPSSWVIVDDGSDDATPRIAASLAERLSWVSTIGLPRREAARGAPVVRAFTAGLERMPTTVDVIVKLDADVSFDPDHFLRLLEHFAAEPRLGLASGTALEWEDGRWVERMMTGQGVWGAVHAYRRTCLEDLLPLESRMGWDTLDSLKASMLGWDVRVFRDLPFRHHRLEGSRDGRWQAQLALGRCSYYLGYRPSYQLLRTLHHLRHDPTAVGLLLGYALGAVKRDARCADAAVRSRLREQQRVRRLLERRRETLGRGGTP